MTREPMLSKNNKLKNPRVHGSGMRVEHGSEIATRTRTRPHPRVQTHGCTRDPCQSLRETLTTRPGRAARDNLCWKTICEHI